MATKLQLITDLYGDTAKQVTDSADGWKSYLTSAARLYKYTFDEQLLLYAQRPDATACANMELWNGKMNRWVKPGSKGIALIHKSASGKPRLEYVFDVADTRPVKGAKTPWLWEMREELQDPVLARLEAQYGETEGDFGDRLMELAARAVGESYREHLSDLAYDMEDSFLEGLDDLNLEVRFKNVLTASVQYTLLTRCGLDPMQYLEDDDLQGITEFSTTAVLSHIGNATSNLSGAILAEIGSTIRNYQRSIEQNLQTPLANNPVIGYTEDREKFNTLKRERSMEHGRVDISEERGLSHPEPHDGGNGDGGTARQVRDAAPDLFAGAQERNLHLDADDGQAVAAPSGDRPDSTGTGRPDAESTDGAERRERADESQRPDEMGAGSEQSDTDGRGSGAEGTHLQLNSTPKSGSDTLPDFVHTETHDLLHELLRHDRFLKAKRPAIADYFAQHTTDDERSAYMKSLYDDAFTGFDVGEVRVGYRAQENGLNIWRGNYLTRSSDSVLSWDVVQGLVAQLMEHGNYLAPEDMPLIPPAPKMVQISLFPSVEQQIENIAEAQAEEKSSAFSFAPVPVSQAVIDRVLSAGSNEWHSIERFVANFQVEQTGSAYTGFVQKEYGKGGKGFSIDGRDYAVWFNEDGLRIAPGRRANVQNSTLIPWVQVSIRIRQLLLDGQFATQEKLDAAHPNTLKELAESLWYMRQNFSKEAHEQGYTPIISENYKGFPESTKKLAVMLADPDQREAIISEVSDFADAYAADRDLLRWRHYQPQDILRRLEALRQEPTLYTAAPDFTPQRPSFITEDEIDELLARGSGISEGKMRIYSYFAQGHDAADCARFLREEYGTGGGGWRGRNSNHDSKGLDLSREDEVSSYDKVFFNWNQVEKRVRGLITADRYLNEKEKAHIPQYEKNLLARSIATFKSCMPDTPYDPGSYGKEPPPLPAPEDMGELLSEMRQSVAFLPPDYRHHDLMERILANVEAYANGIFSLFTPLSTEKLATEKAERAAAKAKARDLDDEDDEPQDDLMAAAKKLSRKKPATTKENAFGQMSLDFSSPAPAPAEPEKPVASAEEPVLAVENEPALQEYDLGYGHMGNGLTVWNRLEEVDGDYKTIAHIAADRTVSFYDDALPDEVKAQVEEIAATSEMTVSTTQDAPVFHTPPAESEPTTPEPTPEPPTAPQKPTQKPSLAPLADAYLDLKAQHPDKLVGVEVGDYFLFYGKDAEIAAPALGSQTITRDIPGLGETLVTGSKLGWQSNLTKLLNSGHSVLFASPSEENPDAYDIIKERTAAEYIPIGMELVIDGRKMRIDSVDFSRDKVSLQDMEMRGWFPIFREESVAFVRSFVEEQQVLTEQDIVPEAIVPPAVEPAAPKPVEIEGGEIRTETVGVYREGLPFEVVVQKMSFGPKSPERHNFHITDDDLGAGGQKTKYQYNVAAIRTLKQLEAESRLATPEEQETLSRYVGWGGIADAFDPDREKWSKEYAELKDLLTPEEYSSAQGSVLNAHYTSPTVIKGIYSAVEKMELNPGNILEPAMGIGNFFGLVPESMADSRLYGVELDSLTGRIAKQLYQKADITIAGFEKTDRRDFYDLAVGNVPFGQYKVSDKPYDKLNFSIHDYFLAKGIDQLRPGGIMAVVTSHYTMDKQNPTVRQYLAKRADLLGAVRLPNTAFKQNAGTEVTSDILFFQKRDHAPEREPDWVQLGTVGEDIPVNRYFADNPHMILGEMTTQSGQFGTELTCQAIEGANLSDQLAAAITHLAPPDKELLHAEPPEEANTAAERESIPADPDVRNFSFTLVDGNIYFRENSRMKPVELGATPTERVKGMLAIRDSARQLIDLQLTGAPETAIAEEQAQLNAHYDHFTKNYGLINSLGNKQAFNGDSSYPLLCSLEVLDEEGNLERKADMFTKRTIQRHSPVTSVDTAVEALALSIGEKACVDLGYMGALMGGSDKIDTILKDLRGIIFKDPLADQGDPYAGWQTADEYLSGNVRQKLSLARITAETAPEFAINVEKLELVQPKDLSAAEIDVRIGATWIEPKYYQQFLFELLQTPQYLQGKKIEVFYAKSNGEWRVTGKSADSYNNARANATYGTKRRNAYAIIEDSLNLRDTRIFDTVEEDGKDKRVLNAKETAIAQQKQEAIGEAFKEWVWKDPQRREELCKVYNETFNSLRPREYDGQHIRYTGMTPEISLRTHQNNAVAHILYGNNTLLAHCVGAGKTFEMIAAAMESKRLGICQKSLFVVPNHLTEQWGGDFLRLYPGANVLVATKKDFEPANRKKFCARIATGDYDAVVIGHSQFEKIPLSAARQEALIHDEIAEVTDAIREAKEQEGERYTIKQLEKTKKSLETRLQKLMDSSRKDSVVTYEELGVDRLFVDEAHFYKNLFLHTKMRNVAGIGQSEAQKSTDMFGKCRYMDELTGGKGITFATGTPISNSMVELYTMMRYLQFDALAASGLRHFDSWAAAFGEKVTAIELAPEGTGFRSKTRFAKFFNLPEIMNFWKESADIQTADMLHLPVPKAEYITVTTEPSEHQQAMVASLADRAEDVRNRAVEPNIDNMLKITSDGRKLALDQRLHNDLLPDDPDSKTNTCVGNIFSVWQDTTAIKGTQLVFCDLSTPHYDGTFNVYDDMKNKLMEKGIPPEEIAFIHDANTETQKAELFAKVRKGQIRVLLGSTQKMGAGTNVQDHLVALHHTDCPWRPSDIEQREGRILRQGNLNESVKIFKYVTKGTFDAYNWGLVENKQKFIGQVMTSKSPARSAEDIDATALSYAEVKALATGDDRIREKMDLDIQVAKLKLLKANHNTQKYDMEDKVLKFYPQKLAETQLYIDCLTADLPVLTAHPVAEDAFSMTVMGTLYTERKEAGEAIIEACKTMTDPDQKLDLGEYRGFPMKLSLEGQKFKVSLKQNLSYTAELANDPSGNITRINNALEKIPENLEGQKIRLTTLQGELESAKEEAVRPFPKEEELTEKSARLTQLNIELDMGNKLEKDAPERDDDCEDEPPQEGKASILKALKQFEAPPRVTPDREQGYGREVI